ncbi:MAG: peptide-methionine (S)-S-oxide reductase MsrA [Bacteroidetes bacterium]|nr:peptide-methionine (S)-S-oxide reductase MsrA [Bacteroidota bacterium]
MFFKRYLYYGNTELNTKSTIQESGASTTTKIPLDNPKGLSKAVYAGGCFWGVEYYFEKPDGVFDAVSGYTGGTTENPTYHEVLTHTTGHVEAVEVTYDPTVITYEKLTKYFFEIHDPTQTDGQGPDIGNQYLSVVFYQNPQEKESVDKLIVILENEGFDIATSVTPSAIFWPAELYHQDYYQKNVSLPYCHFYTKRFP